MAFPDFGLRAFREEGEVEGAEAADFDALPDHEAVAHGIENRLHDDLRVFVTSCG